MIDGSAEGLSNFGRVSSLRCPYSGYARCCTVGIRGATGGSLRLRFTDVDVSEGFSSISMLAGALVEL